MMKNLLLVSTLLAATAASASTDAVTLTYGNTNFNNQNPGWSNTLTIYNHSSQPVVMTNLQFDINYGSLDTTQLYGEIYHSNSQSAVPTKISDYVYRYSIKTESPYSPGTYTTIPANGYVTLTQIPITHDQTISNGIPVYYQLPSNIKVTLSDSSVITAELEGKCSGNACNDPAKGKVVGAYFTNWSNYNYGSDPTNMLMPNQIPIANMNSIYYAIGKVNNQTADVSFSDINHDQFYIPAFATLKQQYPYLNLFYSFGGWGDVGANNFPSYDLATIFDTQDPKLIQKLADNMVNTVRELGFNGIDIDYEWSAIQPGGSNMELTPARAKGYQLLLQDIRADFDKIQPSDNPHYYKVVSAVFAGPDSIELFTQNGGNWTKVAAAVDYLNVMTYDMHGQFDTAQPAPDNITGFLSNMQNSHHYSQDALNSYDVVDAIAAYKAQGVSANKLVMGIPSYTRIEKAAVPITDDNKGLYLTLVDSSQQPSGESKSGGGTTDYKCIINKKYCWGGFSFGSTLIYVPANLSGQGLGALEKTPWAYDKSLNWFMSFDDGKSSAYKGQWANQQGLAGVMEWELDADIPLTDANYQQNSVIYNAWKGLIGQ